MARSLSSADFARARQFVMEQGRPLERAILRFAFAGGKAAEVWEALVPFANADGGFGHGMEPDCRLPQSSCLATITALPYLIETGAGSDHPLVRGAIRYLVDTYDAALGGWHILPPEVNEYPRACWWQYDAAQSAGRVRDDWANPGAAVVADFHAYPALVPTSLLAEVTAKAMAVLDDERTSWPGHSFLTYVELAEHAPADLRPRIWQRLKAVAGQAIATSPEQWSSYGVRPLWAVTEPDSPLMAVLDDAVAVQLDFETGQQQADGAWHPLWHWGQYEEEWQRARVEWQGVLTVKMLRALRAHGRLS